MKLNGPFHHARFIERPNRFLAKVRLGDPKKKGKKNKTVIETHVPDSGRLKELFVPNAYVILRESKNLNRKTQYSLIGVRTKDIWVNVDSVVSNRLFHEEYNKITDFQEYTIIRPEYTYHTSRFDFLMENQGGTKMLVEVKGVTLVRHSLALFPDAPTVRGTKHVRGLARAVDEGYEAAVVFFIKRSDATAFQPNKKMDPRFSEALLSAMEVGVKVYPVRCHFDPTGAGKLTVLELVPFMAP